MVVEKVSEARRVITKAKVLIHVGGGAAYWLSTDDVEVIRVGEYNLNGGDPKVEFLRDFKPPTMDCFDPLNAKCVIIATRG